MDELFRSKNLHHAYAFIGEREEVFLKLKDFLEQELRIETTANPDFWSGEFDSLDIETARDICERAGRRNFSGGKKIFVIKTNSIGQEAQNSLLKVFEEPTKDTHFFIILPQDLFLPTLRSRMQIIFLNETEKSGESILKLGVAKRLEKVKELIEGISDDEKTKQDAITFLNQVEMELYGDKNGIKKDALIACENARQYLFDRGAPVKMILENLMLSI